MLDLMAFNTGKSAPLYLHVINRILRELRIEQQQAGTSFNYKSFKEEIDRADLTEHQKSPLQQRLETLESFMVTSEAKAYESRRRGIGSTASSKTQGNDWAPKVCAIHSLQCATIRR